MTAVLLGALWIALASVVFGILLAAIKACRGSHAAMSGKPR